MRRLPDLAQITKSSPKTETEASVKGKADIFNLNISFLRLHGTKYNTIISPRMRVRLAH